MGSEHPSRHSRAIGAARRLRRDATMPERLLWGMLRGDRLDGIKFRRKHPHGPYVADFYCHSARLVVELDGTPHDDRADVDQRRDDDMKAIGLRVMRFLNDDVLLDIEAVAEAILRAARSNT
jgi:very-short-patch-repair endonuclease